MKYVVLVSLLFLVGCNQSGNKSLALQSSVTHPPAQTTELVAVRWLR